MTPNEIDEMKDYLFDTAQALEEMIVYQEGKLPSRALVIQQTDGFNEARKSVLNFNRTQLRRVKTYMLRGGVIKNKVVPAGEAPQGITSSNVERAQPMPELPRPLPNAPNKPLCAPVDLIIAGFWFAMAVLGIWTPGLHACMALSSAVMVLALVLYWRTVEARP